jgi:serine/threonine protein kinase/WD40 repeat protein
MNTPPSPSFEGMLPPSKNLDAAAPFPARKVIADRYEIVSLLGEGGMSDVWHAYDLKLRMDVALKSVRVDRQQKEDSIETLREEVRIARGVISPNVCRVFDLVIEGQQELISMEYIDGITLMAMLVQKSPLKLSEAQNIAAQFLAGLDAIHNAGFVHCDLKPENIMITRTGRVVVMDFGIAKHAMQKAMTISGTLPYMAPERLIEGATDARSDLFSAGVILAELVHPQRIFSEQTRQQIWDAVQTDPLQLPENPWKSIILRALATRPDNRFPSAGSLARALEEATLKTEKSEERKPYPGLASFSSADAEYFFGRELEVETLLKKLRQFSLMAVIGPSGAGKTSFLRAGLIPALPDDWKTIFCVPGDSPLLNLGQALIPSVTKDTEAMLKILRFETLTTALDLLNQWRKKHSEVLLIVDRFEELFTLNAPEVQSRFAELTANAALDAGVHVLLCMRDDFLFRCHDYLCLDPIFSALMPLGPLAGPGLRRALVQPALTCGYPFEDESLVNDILSAVEKEKGALPLMAFCAFRLWQKRDRTTGQLTRNAYNEIGGVAGALALHAEETMERIGPNREPIVREIFRNMITAENTRSAREKDELLSVFDNPVEAEEVLRTLIDARLLTTFEASSSNEEAPRRLVEVIHESLLTAWPRLVGWQTQDADGARHRDQLRQAAHLWEQRGRSKDLLWTGTAFLEFQVWRQRYPGGLSRAEEAFAQAMTQQAEKRRRQRRMALTTIFVVLFVVLAVISNFWRKASLARDQAVLETGRAQASKLLALARAHQDASPSLKLAYAIASLEYSDTTDGRNYAMQALSEGPPAFVTQAPIHTNGVLNFSPDSAYVAIEHTSGIQIIPRDGSKPITAERFETALIGPPRLSSDGEFVVWEAPEDRRVIKVWSLSQRKIVRTFEMEGSTMSRIRGKKLILITDESGRLDRDIRPVDQPNEVVVRTWEFDRTEPKKIAHWHLDGTLPLLFSSDGESIFFIKGNEFYFRSIHESGLGPPQLMGSHKTDVAWVDDRDNELVSVDKSGEIRFWSKAHEAMRPERVISGSSEPHDWTLDPTWSFLTEPKGESMLIKDLNAPEGAAPFSFRLLDGEAFDWATDKTGNWMAISSQSTISLYPLRHQYPYIFRGEPGSDGSFNVRFTPDGKSLLNTFSGKGLGLWSMPGEKSTPSKILVSGSLQAFDVDPSGKYLLASAQGLQLISVPDGKSLATLKGELAEHDSISFSPDGKTAAAVGIHVRVGVEIYDLQAGTSRVLEQSKGKPGFAVRYAADGSLFSGDDSGNLYHWNLNNNSVDIMKIGKGIITSIAITKDGRYLTAIALSGNRWGETPRATSDLVLYDLKNKKLSHIYTHGNRVFSVAFDPQGRRLVTGDLDGIVRVGSIIGETPHLLIGHKGWIADVAISPDGKWIASTQWGSPEFRLWPIPQGKPIHALSYPEFMERLRALTNLRVVANKNSSTGYDIKYDPFPGWEKIPSW